MEKAKRTWTYLQFFLAIPGWWDNEHFFTIHNTYILSDRVFASTELQDLTLEKLSALVERLREDFKKDRNRGEDISNSSLNKIYRVLRKAFELAEDRGLGPLPDISTWKAPEKKQPEAEEDILALLSAPKPPRVPRYVLPKTPPTREKARSKARVAEIRDAIREGSLFFDFARQCYRYVAEISTDGRTALVIDYDRDDPFRSKISLDTLSRDRKYVLIPVPCE
jgi:hypothetical protein